MILITTTEDTSQIAEFETPNVSPSLDKIDMVNEKFVSDSTEDSEKTEQDDDQQSSRGSVNLGDDGSELGNSMTSTGSIKSGPTSTKKNRLSPKNGFLGQADTENNKKSLGVQMTPKGVILRTRLQGNVEITESFSSRGRKIIPKERDEDFMELGVKSQQRRSSVIGIAGEGLKKGRGRGSVSKPCDKEPTPVGRTTRGSKLAQKSNEETSPENNKVEAESKESNEVSSKIHKTRVAKENNGRQRKVASKGVEGSQAVTNKESSLLARKYGRASLRCRNQKNETIVVKEKFVKETPSKIGSIGRMKKDEKNSVKDLYEFEDEDENDPIPELTHKRPPKRVGEPVVETPIEKKVVLACSEEKEKNALACSEEVSEQLPPPTKKPKRDTKGKSRTRRTRRSAAKVNNAKGKRQKSVDSEKDHKKPKSVSSADETLSIDADNLPESDNPSESNTITEPVLIQATESNTSFIAEQLSPSIAVANGSAEPRHLPLKLEMKEQRQAAAAAALAGSKTDSVPLPSPSSSLTLSAGQPSPANVKSATISSWQSNVDRIIDEVARGNFTLSDSETEENDWDERPPALTSLPEKSKKTEISWIC